MRKREKTFSWVGLTALVVAAILTVLVVREAGATNRHDPDVDVDQRQEQEQNQNQDQSQNQDQDQSQTNAQDQANNQSLTVNGSDELKTTGRAWVSSGDATAICQKFGGISTGWLGGALGLGVNWTDKDCMALQIFDRLAASGDVQTANKVLCATKAMARVFGKKERDSCELALNAAYMDDQDRDIGAVTGELSEMSRQASQGAPGDAIGNYQGDSVQEGAQGAVACPDCPDCSDEATRAFETCVAK